MFKVAIVGAEATGKSTLAENLAKYYQTIWVPEYAREYLTHLGRKYTFDDVLAIAQGQSKIISESITQNPFLPIIFIDTELLVTHIWCEYVFGRHHSWIAENLSKQNFDLYLLCNTDLPWEYDVLREQPSLEKRKEIHRLYEFYLRKFHFPYELIEGKAEQRLFSAVQAIEKGIKFFDKNSQNEDKC
ncbi:AAA family ATPase [Raineya sp.]|jgi:NadR type nicotinamide-nucleotide adenylyltransferase